MSAERLAGGQILQSPRAGPYYRLQDSTRYLLRADTGFRAEMLKWTGFSPGGRCKFGVHLSAPDFPAKFERRSEKRTKSGYLLKVFHHVWRVNLLRHDEVFRLKILEQI